MKFIIIFNAEEQYSWFFNRDDFTYRGIRQEGPAIGFDESVKLVEETFEKEGPFDGILGFSQGACFTGLLCSLQQRGRRNIQEYHSPVLLILMISVIKTKFNFAVMAAGFQSHCEVHRSYYDSPINLPSLHICGETDQIIPIS